MGDLIILPGSDSFTVEQALDSAKMQELDEVLVVGISEGELVIRSNKMSRRDALWLLEQAKLHVLRIEGC